MLAYTFYEAGGRVMRYAETLVQAEAIFYAIELRMDMQQIDYQCNHRYTYSTEGNEQE